MYLTVLLCCGVLHIGCQQWMSWMILLAVLWLPVFSLAVSLPGMLCFQGDFRAPERLVMGQPGEIWLVGKSRLPVPPFRGKFRLTRLTTGEQWDYRGGDRLPVAHCGGLQAVAGRMWVYDYLGLIGIPVRKKESRTVVIRPKPRSLGSLPELDRFLARSWRPKYGGGYAENHELRLYRPGDSLNQVHWKLTAKTGKLTIREPMQPDRGLVLLTMNLRGTPEELDRKFGRLLWLGGYLLDRNVEFECRVLTAEGIMSQRITALEPLTDWIDVLLQCRPVDQGDLRSRNISASWQYHIGGGPDEA